MIHTHTPEPWSVGETMSDGYEYPETVITAMDGMANVAVAVEFCNFPGMREDNARRIVASVNACTGISTKELEQYNDWLGGCIATVASQRAEIARLQAQRDELLKAMRPFVDHGMCVEPHHIETARATIKSATKDQA